MQNILIGPSFQERKILQKGHLWEVDIEVSTNITHSEKTNKQTNKRLEQDAEAIRNKRCVWGSLNIERTFCVSSPTLKLHALSTFHNVCYYIFSDAHDLLRFWYF